MLFELAYETRAAEAAEPCPDRGAFVAAVQARTSRASEGPGEFRLRVKIDAEAGGAKGALEIRDPDGAEQRRDVAGRTCAEVVKGLALVTALVLDPDADEAPITPIAPPPAPVPPAPPTAVNGIPPTAVPPPARPETPPPSKDERARWRAFAGGTIGATGGIGPGVAPVVGLFASAALDTTSLVAPSLRIGLDFAGISEDLVRGSQSYLWVAGEARACPVYVTSAAARIRVGPCAGFQIGWHRGATNGVVNASTSSDLWLAPSASGSLEWALTSSLTLELAAGALFPLRRPRFFLAPSTTLYEVPQTAGFVTIGALVRFL